MKHLCRLLLFLCFLCSCEETKKEKMKSLVSKWEGKAIAFPSYSVFTIQGTDTIDFIFPRSEYKVVTYVDSIECACDDLNLSCWKSFMHKTDSLTKGEVHFVFYFNTKNQQKLRYLTLRDQFTYPVCFDTKSLFYRLNQFTTGLPIVSFLLDNNDKVLTIGDPINDTETQNDFLQIMANAN